MTLKKFNLPNKKVFVVQQNIGGMWHDYSPELPTPIMTRYEDVLTQQHFRAIERVYYTEVVEVEYDT